MKCHAGPEGWLADLIFQQLKRVYSLRLPGSPAADKIQALAEEWCLSVNRQIGQPIEVIDTPRIISAFNKIIDKVDKWPPPSMVGREIPPRPQRLELPVPDINIEGMERGSLILEGILDGIEQSEPWYLKKGGRNERQGEDKTACGGKS